MVTLSSSSLSSSVPTRTCSVPSWPAEPPPPDSTGRGHLFVAVGAEGAAVAQGWRAHVAAAGRPHRTWATDEVTPESERELLAHLAETGVGWRVAVAGPEADVSAAAAIAFAAGVLPEEVTTFATSRETIAVFCAHCAGTHRLAVSPGDATTCPGCESPLEVHEHASHRRGSYLASAPTPVAPDPARAAPAPVAVAR